jgi:hypothetical protein
MVVVIVQFSPRSDLLVLDLCVGVRARIPYVVLGVRDSLSCVLSKAL